MWGSQFSTLFQIRHNVSHMNYLVLARTAIPQLRLLAWLPPGHNRYSIYSRQEQISFVEAEVYSEPSKTSKMGLFEKIVEVWKLGMNIKAQIKVNMVTWGDSGSVLQSFIKIVVVFFFEVNWISFFWLM